MFKPHYINVIEKVDDYLIKRSVNGAGLGVFAKQELKKDDAFLLSNLAMEVALKHKFYWATVYLSSINITFTYPVDDTYVATATPHIDQTSECMVMADEGYRSVILGIFIENEKGSTFDTTPRSFNCKQSEYCGYINAVDHPGSTLSLRENVFLHTRMDRRKEKGKWHYYVGGLMVVVLNGVKKDEQLGVKYNEG